MTPMNNISAPTYRDGVTYTRTLEQIKNWLNDILVPDFNDGIANAIAEFQNGIANAEKTVTDTNTDWTTKHTAFTAAIDLAVADFKTAVNTRMTAAETDIAGTKTTWQTKFDQFMIDVQAELAALNDAAVAGLINDPASQAGAAARTLIKTEDDAREINAYNAGVRPGLSTDSTAAINAVLTQGAGKVVTIPAGTYRVSGVSIPADTILMAYGVTFIETGVTDVNVVNAHGSASIYGLTIHGNRVNLSTGEGISISLGAGSVCSGITMKDIGGVGIQVADANQAIIENCHFTNIALQAVVLTFAKHAIVRGNYIDGALHGVQFWGGDSAVDTLLKATDILITDNIVKNVVGGLWGSLGERVIISENTVENCTDVGLDLEGCKFSQVINNTARNCTNGGMAVFFGSTDCIFSGNTVLSFGLQPGFKAHNGNGLVSKRLKISDNTIQTEDGAGVVMDVNGMVDSVIENNIIRVTVGTAQGIRILDANGNTVRNNEINVAGPNGITVEGGSDTVVSGNRISKTGADITTIGTNGGVNVIWRSATYPAQNNEITGNRIVGFTTSIADNCGGDVISHNMISYNRAQTITHYGVYGAGYYGRITENFRHNDPTVAATITQR